MTVFALLNVLLAYHLGHGRRRTSWFLVGGAVSQAPGFVLFHGIRARAARASVADGLGLLVVHEGSTQPHLGAELDVRKAKA